MVVHHTRTRQSKSSLCSYPKGAPFPNLHNGSVQAGAILYVTKCPADDSQSCSPGYEPLAPPPPAAASVPVWQDRTIASSRLRLLEYSAFVEVQRDPDTVMCLG